MPASRSPVDEFYRSYLRRLVKEAKADAGMTYKDLAKALRANGVRIGTQVLTNRVNRGAYKAAFAFQVFSVLGIKSIDIPEPPKTFRKQQPKR